MLKQFLSKLPRKALKFDERPESRRTNTPRSASRTGPSGLGGGTPQSNGGNSLGPGKANPPKRMSSAVFPASVVAGIEPLVPFKDVPTPEKMNLFISKVSLCYVTFDFTDPTKNSIEKDVKKQTLLELVDFVATGSMRFGEQTSWF